MSILEQQVIDEDISLETYRHLKLIEKLDEVIQTIKGEL